MGRTHWKPSKVDTDGHGRAKTIEYSKTYHTTIFDLDEFEFNSRQKILLNRLQEKTSLEKPFKQKWYNDDSKVLLTSRANVELRRHIHNGTVYYSLVVINNRIDKTHNLGISHVRGSYENILKQGMHDVFGKVYRPSSRWTSEKIPIERD